MKKRTGTKIMALTGPFAVYEPYATEIVQTIGRQLFPMSGFGFDDEDEDAPAGAQPNSQPEAVGNKIALMRFSGPMTKEDTCASWMLGGFSTMAAAKQIQMVADSIDRLYDKMKYEVKEIQKENGSMKYKDAYLIWKQRNPSIDTSVFY